MAFEDDDEDGEDDAIPVVGGKSGGNEAAEFRAISGGNGANGDDNCAIRRTAWFRTV